MTNSSCDLVPAGSMLIALSRNRIPPNRPIAPLRVSDLEIDALHPHVRQGAFDIRLSPDEHILLYTLAARVDAVVSYREIADALGRTDPGVHNNSLARHVRTLRRKLRDDPDRPRYIETVRGIGYRMHASAPRAAELATKGPRMASRILVVEDDSEVSRLIEVVLCEGGYRVAAVGDGELALRECAIEDPALILLDLNMPGMDGAEFLQAYRARPPARAKVMVISGAVHAAEVARQIVADAFIAKPFDIEILLRRVRRLLPRLPILDAA